MAKPIGVERALSDPPNERVLQLRPPERPGRAVEPLAKRRQEPASDERVPERQLVRLQQAGGPPGGDRRVAGLQASGRDGLDLAAQPARWAREEVEEAERLGRNFVDVLECLSHPGAVGTPGVEVDQERERHVESRPVESEPGDERGVALASRPRLVPGHLGGSQVERGRKRRQPAECLALAAGHGEEERPGWIVRVAGRQLDEAPPVAREHLLLLAREGA